MANNGGANAIPVAEFALTLIMATYRNLRRGDLAVRNDDWYNGDLLGQELFGKTVGIVGAGRIGSMLARLLRGFETTTLYTDVIKKSQHRAGWRPTGGPRRTDEHVRRGLSSRAADAVHRWVDRRA